MSNQLGSIIVESCEAGVVLLRIKVVPNASRTKIAGLLGDRLKIAVSAPPEGGKANKMVCQLLAKTLGVAVKQVAVTSGQTQPQKTVSVAGKSAAAVVSLLEQVVGR